MKQSALFSYYNHDETFMDTKHSAYIKSFKQMFCQEKVPKTSDEISPKILMMICTDAQIKLL